MIPPASHPITPLDPADIEILAYIHSNKFITPKLCHRKFHPHQSYSTAALRLRTLEKKGLLLKIRKFINDDAYFHLSILALRQLSKSHRIPASRKIRLARINPFEKEHDKRVVEMRIQIEASPELKKIVWLSDHEMRCGLKMDWKRALMEGRAENLPSVPLNRIYHRTPDGYFEAVIQNQDYAFVLEYEHSPYPREKMIAMVLNLTRDFPETYRLIVSRDKPQAFRMMEGLEKYLKNDASNQKLWGFSFFEKASRLPLTRVPWVNMHGDYLPFVHDPILKSVSIASEAKKTSSKSKLSLGSPSLSDLSMDRTDPLIITHKLTEQGKSSDFMFSG